MVVYVKLGMTDCFVLLTVDIFPSDGKDGHLTLVLFVRRGAATF